MFYISLEPGVATKLEAKSRTVSSLTVLWDAPLSGDVTEYRIKLRDKQGTETTVRGRATRTSTFTGLAAGTMYTVVLVTVSGDQQSEVLQSNFYTSKCLKPNICICLFYLSDIV